MSPDPSDLPAPPRGGLRGAAIRFSVLVFVVVGGFLVVRFTPLKDNLSPHHIAVFLEHIRGAWWTPFALLGGYCVSALLALPVTPLLAAGAILFGVGLGTVYNLLGCLLGGALGYWFASSLGRSFVVQVLGKRIGAIEKRLADRQGFWTLTRARLLPIPFPVFNFAAALVGVRFPVFFWSTAVGLILPVLLNTVLWASLIKATEAERGAQLAKFVFFLLALFALSLLPGWIAKRRDKKGTEGLGD